VLDVGLEELLELVADVVNSSTHLSEDGS
jgi:hypothetical protein